MTSLAYRPAEPGDMPLIIDAWLKGYRTSHAAGLIPMHQFRRVYSEAVQWVMARPDAETWVAYNPNIDRSTRADLHGWCCVEKRPCKPPLVHYVHVKQGRRRMGMARALLRAAGVNPSGPFVYTSKTPVVTRLKASIPRAKFNPLAARFPPKERDDKAKQSG